MLTVTNFDYRGLATKLQEGNLIPFIGAGVSRSYQDPRTGKQFRGLPTGGDIVKLASKRFPEVPDDTPFARACFLIKHLHGLNELETFLVNELDKPTLPPLPAHLRIANLRFPAYITTNFDRLLEKALQESKVKAHPLVTDDDVARLRPTHTPVIKIHGCVSKPESIIAAEDDYAPLDDSKPILSGLLKSTLANKNLLFLGFALDDPDFQFYYESIKRLLGPRMPKSSAVVSSSSDYQKLYWLKQDITIVDGDLTEFLIRLLQALTSLEEPNIYRPEDGWLNNAFLEDLQKIKSQPTETHVIDAFLDHLLGAVNSPHANVNEIVILARKNSKEIQAAKPNLSAFAATVAPLLDQIEQECPDIESAVILVKRAISERSAVAAQIQEKAKDIVARNDNILLYSQSVRVVQLLNAVHQSVQATCKLYVGECRPKSPTPFLDALATADSLLDSGFELTLIPDMAAINLIERSQISKVFLGAHAVYYQSDAPVAIVNTCGTNAIVFAAERCGVPVYVIAENAKRVDLAFGTSPDPSYQQEEAVFRAIEPRLSELKAQGQRVSALNVGYDLCPISPAMTVVSELFHASGTAATAV
jgi:translation initiation factor 2B subunit (eIF-2B alpha/beta/delta family)